MKKYKNPFIHYDCKIRKTKNDFELRYLHIEGIQEDRYLISNYGDLYDIKTEKWKDGWIQDDGYLRQSLRNTKKKSSNKYSHVMVANTYLENPDPELYTVVNHKDGDKLNCHPSNLEFCTPQQNAQHAAENGFCGAYKFPKNVVEEICVKLDSGWSESKICRYICDGYGYKLSQVKTLIEGMIKYDRYADICDLYNFKKQGCNINE